MLPQMSGQSQKWRRPVAIATAGAALIGVALVAHPVSDGLRKLALLAAFAGAGCGALALAWRHPRLRVLVVCLGAAPVALLLLPGRPIDARALHADYLARLGSFRGVPYVWGGESRRGIDCSGLPRRALREALVLHGLARLNGRALREAARHWWFDASAKALGDGHRGYTKPVGTAGVLRGLDTELIAPGDLAVTADGLHVLVFLGDKHWLQADPGAGEVIVSDARSDRNIWLDQPVTIRRWSLLADPRHAPEIPYGKNRWDRP